MRKFILISALVLASASAQAGQTRACASPPTTSRAAAIGADTASADG